MSVAMRRGAAGLLMILLVAGTPPATAQTTSDEASSSSWTDPPVRGAASPDTAPVEKKPEASPAIADTPAPAAAEKPARKADAPSAATPAQRAATALGVKPVGTGRAASADASAQRQRAAVRPRMVERPLTLVRRPARVVERARARFAGRGARRGIRSYAFVPDGRPRVRVDPYDGRSYAATWSSRRLAGWDGLIHDGRADRIAQARQRGYLIMRMRTYENADGALARRLSPFDGFDLGGVD